MSYLVHVLMRSGLEKNQAKPQSSSQYFYALLLYVYFDFRTPFEHTKLLGNFSDFCNCFTCALIVACVKLNLRFR